MPPTIGAAIRFITSAPVPEAHMTGSRPINRRQHGHQLGPDALRRALDDRLAQVLEARKPPFLAPPAPGERQVEQHHHSGLGVEPGERDQADPVHAACLMQMSYV
jgi:hypothetical protein